MATLSELNRLLQEHGWKSTVDLDDIETGRAPIMDWTHPQFDGKVSTWKKGEVGWWGNPAEHVTSENIQELADWLANPE